MAYTDQWPATPESTPADSELANLLANNIRQLEREIRERMDDVFTDPSGTWAASGPSSPVVPNQTLTGKSLGKIITIHHSDFEPDQAWDNGNLVNEVIRSDLYSQFDTTFAGSIRCPLVLPAGVTIQQMQFHVNRNTASALNLTCTLNYFNFSVPAGVTQLCTGATIANGETLVSVTGGFPHVVLSGNVYFLKVTTPGGANGRVYAANVTYDAPDSRHTY